MAWITQLRGKRVGLDTAPIIYFVEKHPLYVDMLRPFFQAIEEGECTAVTSTITLLEVLIHPIRLGDTKLAKRYRDLLLDSEGLTTIFLSQKIAEEAARLRAFHNIHVADSIQMATAIRKKASFFLTNDTSLPSLPGLQTLVLNDLLKDLGDLKEVSDDQQKDS